MTPAIRGFVLTALFSSFIFGDLMYETTLKTDGPDGTETTARNFYKNDRSRIETTVRNSDGSVSSVIVITRLDKNVIWVLNPSTRTYTEDSIKNLSSEKSSQIVSSLPGSECTIEQSGHVRKILDRNCEEVIAAMSYIDGTDHIRVSQSLWLTSDLPGYEDLFAYRMKIKELSLSPYLSVMALNDEKLKTFHEQVGNIYGFPMEWRLKADYRERDTEYSITISYSVTKYACAPISSNVFEIPSNYLLTLKIN